MADPLVLFYATLNPNRSVCVRCGWVLEWGILPTGGGRFRLGPEYQCFDPLLSILRCPRCQHRVTLGLLAYEAPTANSARATRPLDQELTLKQIAELRTRAGFGGLWVDRPPVRSPGKTAEHAWRPKVNRYRPEKCLCWEGGRVPECPIHGAGTSQTEEPASPPESEGEK